MDKPASEGDLPHGDLDLRGLKCPLPAMLARKALAQMAPRTMLMVLADDPMALVDMPYMCHREGHRLESVDEQPTHAVFHIRARTGPALMPEAEAAPGEPGDPVRIDPSQAPPGDQGA